jgi:hypothetical protein
MKTRFIRGVFAVVAILSTALVAGASPLQPSGTDLWEGAIITGNSPLYTHPTGTFFDARDIFGGNYGSPAKEWTVYEDGKPVGTMHWVEWQTTTPILFGVFHMFLTGDIDPSLISPVSRSISQVNLYSRMNPPAPGDSWSAGEMFYSGNITQPPDDWVRMSVDLSAPITGQYFRGEFFQAADLGDPFQGPRVIELDAFTPTPEPGTIGLTLLALGALLGAKFRVKKA